MVDREKKSLFFLVENQIGYVGGFGFFLLEVDILGGCQFAGLVAMYNSLIVLGKTGILFCCY